MKDKTKVSIKRNHPELRSDNIFGNLEIIKWNLKFEQCHTIAYWTEHDRLMILMDQVDDWKMLVELIKIGAVIQIEG